VDPIVTVLRFGDIERIVGSYGVMLSAALVVGSLLAARAAVRARMDVGATIAILGFGAAGGLFGSWLLFWIVELARTGSALAAVRQPGLVFFGAPLGGGLAMWLSSRQLGVPLGRLADLSLPALPAAHALGRIGCFLGGCCYGQPWEGPWAVTYTHPLAPASHPSVPRHPTPLYESGGLVLIALVFALVPVSHAGRGRRLLAYLACYGLLRTVVEAFRGDAVRGVWLGGLASTSQILSVLVVIGALVGLWLTRGPGPARRGVAHAGDAV